MRAIVFGSVTEVAGIPGAGKTTALETLKNDLHTNKSDNFSKFALRIIKLTRIDRVALLITAIRFWRLLRFVSRESSLRSIMVTVTSAPFRRRPGKHQFGNNLVLEILFLLNDIGTRSAAARLASIITQRHAVVDELWMQGMIGVWLRLPSKKRTVFWQDHVSRRNWNSSIVVSISGNTAASRLKLAPSRPIVRYATATAAPDDQLSEQLDRLNGLARSAIPPSNVANSNPKEHSVAMEVGAAVARLVPTSRLFIWPRTRTLNQTCR